MDRKDIIKVKDPFHLGSVQNNGWKPLTNVLSSEIPSKENYHVRREDVSKGIPHTGYMVIFV